MTETSDEDLRAMAREDLAYADGFVVGWNAAYAYALDAANGLAMSEKIAALHRSMDRRRSEAVSELVQLRRKRARVAAEDVTRGAK